MDPPDYARIKPARGQFVRDPDLFGRVSADGQEPRLRDLNLGATDLAKDLRDVAFARPDGFTRLVEAIAPGDRALQGQILRYWGIRR